MLTYPQSTKYNNNIAFHTTLYCPWLLVSSLSQEVSSITGWPFISSLSLHLSVIC